MKDTEKAEKCICNDGFGMNLSCKAHTDCKSAVAEKACIAYRIALDQNIGVDARDVRETGTWKAVKDNDQIIYSGSFENCARAIRRDRLKVGLKAQTPTHDRSVLPHWPTVIKHLAEKAQTPDKLIPAEEVERRREKFKYLDEPDKAQHSPLPWHEDEYGEGFVYDDRGCLFLDNVSGEDAAFIVEACNNYERIKQELRRAEQERDALLDACEKVVWVSDHSKPIAFVASIGQAINVVRAALALVEKGDR